MTIAALAAAAACSAAGMGIAAVGGFAIAVWIGAVSGGPMAPVAVWTAALGGAMVLAGVAPRRLALPVLGSAAVLAAGSSHNAAVVLAAWILGSVGAVFGRDGEDEGRRWATSVLSTDILVAAAVVVSAFRGGLVGWPGSIDPLGATLLVLAAFAKVPLVAGRFRSREPGLMVIRTQVVVLAVIGIAAAPRWAIHGAAILAALVFAVGAGAVDATARDTSQEAGLAVMAIAVTSLGWRPAGWLWGVLAGGTLIHWLRLKVAVDEGIAAVQRLILTGGGIGLPFLPAVAAMAAAASGHRGWPATAIVLGLGCGLAARVGGQGRLTRRARSGGGREDRADRADRVPTLVVIGLAVIAALWAGLLATPRPPAGGAVPWPPLWAGLVVLAAGGAGSRFRGLAPAREPAHDAERDGGLGRLLGRAGARAAWVADRATFRWSNAGLAAALGATAAAVWIAGWLRGFL